MTGDDGPCVSDDAAVVDATEQVVYSHGKMTVRQRLQGLYDVAASCFADVEVALGLAEEEEEDSDIDF